MQRKIIGTVAATAVAALTFGGTGLTPAQAAPVAQKASEAAPIDWGTCDSAGLQRRGAECAKIEVPLDYSNPYSTKIKIAISRIKHTVPDDQYQGVMLVNPGGPGGSGLTLSVLGEYVPKDAGLAYDWIGFDPRGVGSSEPAVSCDPEYFGYGRPKYIPVTKAIENAWFAKTNDYTQRCDANNGKILDHLTTIESAKDMDEIRKALGADKINYYGFSYGTYLGQVYATLYPQNLRRAVFDGTVDPRGVWYKANLAQDVAFDRNMNIWFRWIAKHDDVYGLGDTKEGVRALWYSTRRQLDKTPVQSAGGPLGGSEFTDAFLYAGYYQSTWEDLAQVFSSFINDDDVDSLEAAYLDANGYGDDNGYAVYLGVQCTDTSWPESWKTWKRDNDRIYKEAPFETWANAWYNEPCRHWPGKVRKPVNVTGKGVSSLLMINETLDAATPYSGSLEVRKRFKNASLIAVPGGTTHSNSLNGNECVDDAIADYLLTGKKPARRSGNRSDLHCEALPQPDPSAATLRRQKAADDGTSRLDLQKIAVRH